jgi:ABC-type sugar transport system substrate-binding protein
MKKSKNVVLSVLTLVLIMSVFSCSKKQETKTAEKANDGKIKVGFTVQDMTNTYYITLCKGITDRQDAYNVELIVHDAKSDAASQVTAIENFITQGVDFIVINPLDAVVPEAAVKEAQKAGILVVSWSEYVEGTDWFLSLRQYDYGNSGGEIAGKWAAEHFPNQSDVKAMFIYVPDIEALAERGQGMKDGFFKYCPGAEMVAEQSGHTPDDGMRAVEATLIQHPDLNMVVCWNDTVALGAYEAMLAAGKKPGEAGVVGLDATEPALEKIRDNTLFVGTSDVDVYGQGKLFLDMVVEVLKTGPKPDPKNKPFWATFKPVSKENVGDYFN